MLSRFAGLVLAVLMWGIPGARAQTEVDLALVLAVDISYSMDVEEQALQREGFAEAFRSPQVHDAIRRRCLYHWVDYPDAARERAILRIRAPGVPEKLSAQVVAFVQRLRGGDYFKLPGVAETIDWAAALTALDAQELEPAAVDETLGVLLKYQDDIAKLRGAEAARLVAEAKQAAA